MKFGLCFLYFSLFIGQPLPAAIMLIGDADIKKYLTKDVPDFDSIGLHTDQVKAQERQFQDQFSTAVFGETTLAESDDPRSSEWTKQQVIGAKKNFGFGIDGSLSYIYRREKLSAWTPPPLTAAKVYAPAINLNLEFDLWKNFMGSLDDVQSRYLAAEIEKSSLYGRLQAKQFHLRLRTIYWKLVAQERRVAIFEELVKTSRRAYRQMQSRLRDNVADPGAVANMAANLSTAEANHRGAVINRNFIERELKTLVPALQAYELRVADGYPQIRNTVLKCVSCAQRMGRLTKIPLEYTDYDELMASFEKALLEKEKEISRYDSLDIQLSLQASSYGLDADSGEANKQPWATENTSYTAVLGISKPLGKTSETEKLVLNNARRSTTIQKAKINSNLEASHQNLQRNFTPLERVVSLFHKSIRQQTKAFKDTNRKFRQGRISVIDYISDQNALLSSKLQVLQVEEQIITEMLRYYMTFNLVPCEFNRI